MALMERSVWRESVTAWRMEDVWRERIFCFLDARPCPCDCPCDCCCAEDVASSDALVADTDVDVDEFGETGGKPIFQM